MFIVVDASLWVARLIVNDVFYEPVKAWMSAQLKEENQFLAPSFLLAEVGGAVSRRSIPALAMKAVRFIQDLPGLQLVEMEAPLLREAATLAAKLGLRGADSIYVALAARLEIPFVTLDEDQRTRSAGHVTLLGIPF